MDDDVTVVGPDPFDGIHRHDDGTHAMRNQNALHIRLWRSCRRERRDKVALRQRQHRLAQSLRTYARV